jgi:oligopeptide/dipeptide ABC transporter ATP-binding protein
VDDVFHNPQNPYTEGLLRSMPKLGEQVERLAVIPGVVPAPTNWPSGCRFYDRCPYHWDKTLHEEPPLFEIAPDARTSAGSWSTPSSVKRCGAPAAASPRRSRLGRPAPVAPVAGSPDDVDAGTAEGI